MNEQIDNSSPLSLSQALELIKTRKGENFSKEKVNLAELQRLTGITRGKLRRLRRTVLQLQFHLVGAKLCSSILNPLIFVMLLGSRILNIRRFFFLCIAKAF